MKNIKDTELILTKEKKIYHLKLEKKQIADNIILVGDQERVGEISKYFEIEKRRNCIQNEINE